jgi:hypothetical protein
MAAHYFACSLPMTFADVFFSGSHCTSTTGLRKESRLEVSHLKIQNGKYSSVYYIN